MQTKQKLSPTRYFILFLVFLLAACTPGTAKPQQKTLSVSGAFALYPLMTLWAEEYQAAHPDIRIDVTAGGAGKGVSDTLSGAVDIGMVSRELAEEEINQGAFPIAVARDAVFGTINTENPYYNRLVAQGISQDVLEKIYITGEVTTWGQVLDDPTINDEIHVYTRSDSAGAAEMWAKYLGNKKQEDLLGIGVNADPGLSEAVVKDPLGIGYNNLNYLFDPSSGNPISPLAPLPLDINANGMLDTQEVFVNRDSALKAVADGVYPSPPARDLYLITLNAPAGAAKDFINWILNEGQTAVSPNGYVQLTTSKLDAMRLHLSEGK